MIYARRGNKLFAKHLQVKPKSGESYFCESFYVSPCPTSGKNDVVACALGAPAVLLLSLNTQQGVSLILAMTRRDAGKHAFLLSKVRENTCIIASRDYSTPASRRRYQNQIISKTV